VKTKLAEQIPIKMIVQYVMDMTGLSRATAYREIKRQTLTKKSNHFA
jgi:predicted DNA-binding transcriptional regulator AlpA